MPLRTSMTLGFNGTNYTATGGTATFVAPTGTALALSDDSEVAVPLPTQLRYYLEDMTDQLETLMPALDCPVLALETRPRFPPTAVIFSWWVAGRTG